LNAGILPKGVDALVEQRAGPMEADVLAIEHRRRPPQSWNVGERGLATLGQPTTRIVRRTTRSFYADRANRIVIKHHLGRTLAVIELVSPGNKDSRVALREFVEKTIDFLRSGIHVLVVDLFPPTPRDPCGIHKVIWDEISEEPFVFPEGKDRILASYNAGSERAAYVEPIGVGDDLPGMPLFLTSELHVAAPLETTYRATWDSSAEGLRLAVESGVLPDQGAE
jgi:hypothetical protein